MSADTVGSIIRKAIQNVEFRGLLARDPAQALASYELSAEETANLTAISLEQFDAMANDLEARVSRVSLGKACNNCRD